MVNNGSIYHLLLRCFVKKSSAVPRPAMARSSGSLREDAEGEDIAPGGEDFASEEQGQNGQWLVVTGT